MSSSVIMVTTYDPAFLAIFEHLVIAEVDAGNQPIAFDVTPVMSTTVDTYDRRVLRRFGLAFPGHDVAERLTALGAEYLREDAAIAPEETGPLDDRLEEALEMATESALLTYTRTDRPDRTRRSVARIVDRLQRDGRVIYRRVAALCAQRPGLAGAYLINGRFPNQKLSLLAFQDAGVTCHHIEKGERPGRAYVQDYSPHDRFRSQGTVEDILGSLSRGQVDEIADAWLAARAPSSTSLNQYSALWDDSLPAAVAALKKSGTPLVGFFTSSQDEYQSVGAEWHVDSWVDQFDAFDQILSAFERQGYASYLRVHPNLATKAHGLFKRERERIRWLQREHPTLTVLWHDEAANTYALLEASDAVVVFASTVGLEASARGVPVWAASATRYGLTADVRELLSPDDLERSGVTRWEVDTGGAKRYIAYLVQRDQQMSTSLTNWMPWDAGNPPLAVRLSAIPVSGGVPTRALAARSVVDVYRHRGVRANLRARRRR